MEGLPGRAGAAAPARRSSRAGRRWGAQPYQHIACGGGGWGGWTSEPFDGSASALRERGKGGRQHKSLIPDIRVHTPRSPFQSTSADALKRAFGPRSRCEAEDKAGAGCPSPGAGHRRPALPACRGHGRRPSGRVPAGALVPGPSDPRPRHLPAAAGKGWTPEPWDWALNSATERSTRGAASLTPGAPWAPGLLRTARFPGSQRALWSTGSRADTGGWGLSRHSLILWAVRPGPFAAQVLPAMPLGQHPHAFISSYNTWEPHPRTSFAENIIPNQFCQKDPALQQSIKIF